MPITQRKFNLRSLKNLGVATNSGLEARVGVLGSYSARNGAGGESNASIGATHEFGSKTRNIPARSWLRMPVETKAEQIQKRVLKRRDRIEKDMAAGDASLLFETLGIAAEEAIQEAFESGGFGKWKKNAPSTVREKGSSSPLINTGQLRGAVLSKVEKRR